MKPIQYNFFSSYSELKNDAKDDLQTSMKDAVIVNFISKILPKLVLFFSTVFLVISLFWLKLYSKWDAKRWTEPYDWAQKFFLDLKWTVNARTLLIIIILLVIAVYIPLRYGSERYFLLSAKNEDKVEIKEVFSGFKIYFKIFFIELQREWINVIAVIALYITLRFFDVTNLNFLSRSLLIISSVGLILGTIHSYKAKMVLRIEVENPEMTSDEMFELSKKLMDKRILSYIGLNLSFIPLQLLSIITLFIWDLKILTIKESSDAFFYLDLK